MVVLSRTLKYSRKVPHVIQTKHLMMIIPKSPKLTTGGMKNHQALLQHFYSAEKGIQCCARFSPSTWKHRVLEVFGPSGSLRRRFSHGKSSNMKEAST